MLRKYRSFIISIAAFLIMVLFAPRIAYCVHKVNGGSSTFICSGCHTIHNSEDGEYKDDDPDTATANPKLLRFTSDDLCYACHDASGALNTDYSEAPVVKKSTLTYSQTDPNSIGAGGNFAYIDPNTGGDTGDTANQGNGHNFSDTEMVPAGGTGEYAMHCCTCHDPHGASSDDNGTEGVDTYRNLRKDPDGNSTGINITNRIEGTTQNADGAYSVKNNAYGVKGVGGGSHMSEWCEQCHGTTFHGSEITGSPARYTRHPVDIAMEDTFGGSDTKVDVDPNAYELDGDIFNNDGKVKLPLEDGPLSAIDNNYCTGNEKKDRVFCLSCHFPHAGPYADALRWDNSGALTDGVGCQQCHAK